MPSFLTAQAGEDGYLVIPHGRAWTGSLLCRLRQRPDTSFATSGSVLPIFGLKGDGRCIVAIVTGMAQDFSAVASVTDGRYAVYARFDLEGDPPYEDLCVAYHELSGSEANYSGMARRYRRYQLERGACRPLRDRLNPELAYAAQSVEIRIRLGWKPVPSPVLDQTLANEPPMKVAMTFRQVGDLLDELQTQGIDKAQICLVGWNQKGHDGRWPQVFPVEEALGGESDLRELIGKARAMGYQLVCHTNSTCAYHIADCWDEDLIIKNRDGSVSVGATWSGGQTYNLCPQKAREVAERELPRVAGLGFRGLHYIDVLSIYPPRKCYDPNHPLHRGAAAAEVQQIMTLSKQLFGGFASEGAFDHTAAGLDFALYVTFNLMGKQPDIADAVIPLWELVYHGIILSNPSAETVNVPLKGRRAELKRHEHGGRPAFYIYSRFVEGNRVNWMGQDDLTADTPEQLQKSVQLIKQVYDEYRKETDLQLAFLDEHEWLSDTVCRTRYSDGTAFIYNYGDEPYNDADGAVPPQQYRLIQA
jgi:hypothetical protein